MTVNKIGFFGLGLIGGSLARTIHRIHPDIELIAKDIDAEALEHAVHDGVISHAATTIREFAECDILILCTPVHTNVEFLEDLRPHLSTSCLITDVGSVKGEMHEAIERLNLNGQFVGGHPMAGSEKSGYDNSTAYLFENVYFILTPTAGTPADVVNGYKDFIASLGSIPFILEPDVHDRSTASISHIPHIYAAALVNMVKHIDTETEPMKTLAAGGFKDITRIASSSPVMWQQICLANRTQILNVMSSFKEEIETITSLIEASDADGLYDYFSSSRNYRDSFDTMDRGPIKKIYYMYCDLIDEAGGIANVAQILAVHHINIKNIGIIHNREFEEGVLRIEFYDESSVSLAIKLLKKYHYTVHESKQ